MAIQGVDTKCYILALFVRDDGERFLLGSGHYEFKNTQMHFAANAIQNDIVEVQGNDGFLLAGQVRRPGTQSFDGYVGDGTMSKEETESYRRQFFSFFRKNFFYKVIYVFSDGTAIQRKSGFLVDDPTVEELYQMYPEYHVALNFEDVNYYSYSEDEEGQEQYAKEATIDTSSMRATGGLVWDNLGVVWEATQWGGEQTASGTEITIQNDMSVMSRVDDIRLDGDTYQQTYSGKNLIDSTNLTYIYANSPSQIELSTIDGGIRMVNNGGASQDRFAVFKSVDLTPYVGKVVRMKATFGTGGGIRLYRIASDGTGRSQQATTTTSDNEISFIVPADLGTSNYLGYVLDVPTGGGTIVDFTNLIMTIDESLEPFEPYTGGIPAPNPDYPQAVQTVTGEQTVTIDDGNGDTQSYTIDLGSTELCKIGDYQDYIYKSGDDWYMYKAIGKMVLDGTESWSNSGNWWGSGRANYGMYCYFTDLAKIGVETAYNHALFCNDFSEAETGLSLRSGVTEGIKQNGGTGQQYIALAIAQTRLTDVTSRALALSSLENWLSTNKPIVYHTLATPTDTKITDATLVGQLNALGAMRLFIGENNLIVQATGTNLPAPLSFKYYTTVAMTGAEWEEGGSGGATVVEVDSITNTYPIWRVKGPAVDPQLSVINTNTTIRYTGTVTSTQTLEIDMFNKTAKLNGVSVIGNVSGDWVSLAPGTNRVIYTAENADAQPSTIEWQEVVG